VCFQHFSLFPQFVPIRLIRVASFSISVFQFFRKFSFVVQPLK